MMTVELDSHLDYWSVRPLNCIREAIQFSFLADSSLVARKSASAAFMSSSLRLLLGNCIILLDPGSHGSAWEVLVRL